MGPMMKRLPWNSWPARHSSSGACSHRTSPYPIWTSKRRSACSRFPKEPLPNQLTLQHTIRARSPAWHVCVSTKRSIMHRACYKSSPSVVCGVAIALWSYLAPAMGSDAPAAWSDAPKTATAPSMIDTPTIEDRTYSLPELLQLALSINPQTREAQEQAYQAHLATELAKS